MAKEGLINTYEYERKFGAPEDRYDYEYEELFDVLCGLENRLCDERDPDICAEIEDEIEEVSALLKQLEEEAYNREMWLEHVKNGGTEDDFDGEVPYEFQDCTPPDRDSESTNNDVEEDIPF